MMDVIAAAGRLREPERAAAPGASGHGVGVGKGWKRAADREFEALVGGPGTSRGAAAAAEGTAEGARPAEADLPPDGQAVPVPSVAQPEAVGQPNAALSRRGDAGDGSRPPLDAWDAAIEEDGPSGEGQGEPALPSGPGEPGVAGDPAGRSAPSGGLPASAPPGPILAARPACPDLPGGATAGLPGASRAESVLAALVAAQGSAAGSVGRAGEEAPAGSPGRSVSSPEPAGSAAAPAGPPAAIAAKAAMIDSGEGQAPASAGARSGPGPSSVAPPSPSAAPSAAGREDRAGPVPRSEGLGGLAQQLPPDSPPPGHRGTAALGSAAPSREAARRHGDPIPPRSGTSPKGGSREVGLGTGRQGPAIGGPAPAPPAKEGGERGPPGLEQAWPGERAVQIPAAVEAAPAPPFSEGPRAARHVAGQVAEHPVLRTGGAAEMSLNPEELGHLRLTVEGSEGALRVVIEAVRPETADLLRRHVEALRQELRQEGLGSVGVSIGGGGSRQGGESSPRSGSATPDRPGLAPAAAAPPAAFAPAARERSPAGHLDLRF